MGYGQEKFSLSLNQVEATTVFARIQKASAYRFFYLQEDIKKLGKINIHVTDATVPEIMELVLGSSLAYKIINDHLIVISPNKINLATQVEVKGKVLDESGNPLEGASVRVKGQATSGVTTTADGAFSIVASNNDVLEVSMVGYESRDIAINNRAQLEAIVLKVAAMSLDQVVVVGYGKEKKINLTGSVASVSGDDLAKRQVGQTSQALQGLIPGVTVTQPSGQPGIDGGTIRIRGIGTLNDANPLILVDGLEMSMDNIDPSTIQSISVLKDAASASIYGSKAANGVILITTKRGRSGKLSANYSSFVGFQRPTNLPDMVDGLDHVTLINEAYVNSGRLPLYPDSYVSGYKANRGSDQYPDEDWQKAVLTGSGIQTGHTLSMSGGSDVTKVFASVGYLHQDGLLKPIKYERYFARLNSDIALTKKLSASVDLFVSHQKRNAPSQFPGGQAAALSPQSTTGTNLIFATMNKFPANKAAKYSNGLWGEGQNGVNPVAILEEGGFWKETAVPIQGNLSLEYKPWQFLTAKFNYSIALTQPQVTSFVNSIQTYTANGLPAFLLPAKNYLNQSSENERKDQVFGTLNFSKEFHSHALSVLAGFQYENNANSDFSAFRDNFPFTQYTVLSAGSLDNMQNDGLASELTLLSYFGRLNYNYMGKYLFEANVRYDGSSRFRTGHKWGLFPSFAAGWRLSEEDFMSSLKGIIQDVKIRATWGQLGNQKIGGRYPFASTLSFGETYVSNGIVLDGMALSDLAATDISWESTEMTNLGIDFTILRNLSGTFDYYFKKTTGILLQLNIPLTMGLSAPYQNAGVVQNRGWDFSLNYRNAISNLKYSIGVSLSDVKNKIVDLHGIQNTGVVVNHEGYPINSLYLYKSNGLISSKDMVNGVYSGPVQFGNVQPGDIAFEDSDGSGQININDRKILGSTIPRYTYGVNVNLGWQGFDFSLLLQGVGKQDGYLSGSAIEPFAAGGTAYEYQKNRWTTDNPDPNAVFPRLFFSGNNNYQPSDWWMRSAAYLRIKNIQLGYTPSRLINADRGIKELRIYVSADNLFTVDKFWPGWDPEISANSNGAYYPQVKNINVGLNLKF
jgi:TonB-linked SusC/RagA family outer membrane protein